MDNYMEYINSLQVEYNRLNQELQKIRFDKEHIIEEKEAKLKEKENLSKRLEEIKDLLSKLDQLPADIIYLRELDKCGLIICGAIFLIIILTLIGGNYILDKVLESSLSSIFNDISYFLGILSSLFGGFMTITYHSACKNRILTKLNQLKGINEEELLSEKSLIEERIRCNEEEINLLQNDLDNKVALEQEKLTSIIEISGIIEQVKMERQLDLEKLALKYEPELNGLFLQNQVVRERKKGIMGGK